MVASPCLNCIERKYKCHTNCIKYLNFKECLEQIRKAKIKENEKATWSIGAIRLRKLKMSKGDNK